MIKLHRQILCPAASVLVTLLLWLASSAGVQAAATTIFPNATTWKFFKGMSEASSPDTTAWRQVGFNDGSWATGTAPFYYENGSGYSGNTQLTDMYNGYTCVFMRKTFLVGNPADVSELQLSLLSDDGCIVWINGTEVARFNMPGGNIPYNGTASPALGEPIPTQNYTLNNLSYLLPGTNVVAVQAFNASLGSSSDFLIQVALSSLSDITPPSVVEISPPASSVVRELSQIEVFFDENVSGVDVSDLLINGNAATNLQVYSPREYLFEFPEPPTGTVNVAWSGTHGITDLAGAANAFAGGNWTYTLDPNAPASIVIISEFMASNDRTIDDDDGDASDWIEILNLGPLPVDLNGWALTDDPANLLKWRFPSRTLAVNEYLVVWASEKNRINPAAPLHTSFKLDREGEYLALVDNQTNVVSEFSPVYPVQQTDVSYGRDRVDTQVTGFFVTPTPGAPNSTSGPGFAPTPVLSPAGGVYDASTITVTMSTLSGVIRYTTDGSDPTASSPAYSGGIVVNNSTVIKARVFQSGLLPGEIVVNSYNMVGTGLPSFSSKLPVVIINTSGQSISQDQATRTRGTVTVIDTFRGRSSLSDKPQFQGPCQVEQRGQTSAGFPKKPYNLEINDAYGNDLEVPLLGLPAESDWVLNNPYSDKSFLNNFLTFELHEKMGHYAVRRRLVEVFVDTTGGKLNYPQDYMGVYVLLEKIKIDNNRVDLDRLTPSDNSEPDISGGYIFKKDKDSPGDLNFGTSGGGGFSGQGLKMHEPKPREITTAQRNWINNYLNRFESALYSSSWLSLTGTNHYSNYIDSDSFVDYHWIVEFAKQIDGYRLSNYMSKDRGGKVKMEPIWDWNLSFGNADYLDGWITSGWYYSLINENQHIWLRRLIVGNTGTSGTGDPDFIQKMIDRWGVLRTNIMAASNVVARLQELADLLDESAARDFQKWPRLGTYIWPNPSMYVSPTTYQGIIDAKIGWINGRYAWIDIQFIKAPQLNHGDGNIPPGFNLTMSAPSGTIYYTLDGTDPRAAGGNVSPSASSYSGAVALNANVKVFARARSGSGAYSWSPPAIATLVVTTPALVVTELMYHPADPPPGSTNSQDDFEFIELKNTGSSSVQLGGISFVDGISFTFPSGSLAAGARVLVVRNQAAFEARYGAGFNIAGEYSGSLDNGGEHLALAGPLGEPILDFSYNDSWHRITDGYGFSLVIADEDAAANALSEEANWRASSLLGGSPGQADGLPPDLPQVVVNEALTHTDPPAQDRIELYNASAGEADVGGWFLTDDRDQPKKFRIADGTMIPAGGYLSFDEDDFNFGNTAGMPFSIDSHGDEIYLFSGDAGTNLTGYMQGFDFGAAPNGVSFGRHIISTGADHFVAQVSQTPDAINAGPMVGPVVISEIMYHPPDVFLNSFYWDNQEDEFIELHNPSGSSAPLYDFSHPENVWKLRDAVSFTFPPNVTLPPNGYLLVVSFDPIADPVQLQNFRNKYGVSGAVPVYGPYSGKLDNASDSVELVAPDTPDITTVPYVLVDKVHYADASPWPVAADGLGPSLQRIDVNAYGNDPANWVAAVASAGSAYAGGSPPVLTSQPSSQTAIAYSDVMFSVTVTGAGPFRYQWRFNGANIPDATNSMLTLSRVRPDQAGEYQVIVLNAANSTSSDVAVLDLLVGAEITMQPQTQSARTNETVTFTVAAMSESTLSYQWRFNGTNLPGQTSSVLTLNNVQEADGGVYDVLVTDDIGTIPSAPAQLLILINPAFTQLPLAQSVVEGGTVTFSTAVTGSPLPIGFQWRKGSQPLANDVLYARQSFFTLSNVSMSDAGLYRVVVTNAAFYLPGIPSPYATLTVLADTDHDGLPDEFETPQNGLDPNNPADAGADADGDGMTNGEEYIAGTDHTDPMSYLKVEHLEVGGQATIEFLAKAGRTYTIEYTESIGGVWERLADIIATSGDRSVTVVDEDTSAPLRVYRLATPRTP